MSIGTTLNNIAIKTNLGIMPIFPDITYSTGFIKPEVFTDSKDFHIIGDHTSKLIPLCDIFDNGISTYSIGDILIFTFSYIIVYSSIKASNDIHKNKK